MIESSYFQSLGVVDIVQRYTYNVESFKMLRKNKTINTIATSRHIYEMQKYFENSFSHKIGVNQDLGDSTIFYVLCINSFWSHILHTFTIIIHMREQSSQHIRKRKKKLFTFMFFWSCCCCYCYYDNFFFLSFSFISINKCVFM